MGKPSLTTACQWCANCVAMAPPLLKKRSTVRPSFIASLTEDSLLGACWGTSPFGRTTCELDGSNNTILPYISWACANPPGRATPARFVSANSATNMSKHPFNCTTLWLLSSPMELIKFRSCPASLLSRCMAHANPSVIAHAVHRCPAKLASLIGVPPN